MATDNESITEMSAYYQTHQEELQKLLLILNPNASSLLDETDALEDDEKSIMDMRRQSITNYAGSVSLYQDDLPHRRSLRHLSEDQTDLNRLLNRESDDSDSSGPIEKLKKIKTNFFTKTFNRRSGSKRSTRDKQDDSISLKSTASDTSRISLVDIKNELKKFKSLRKPKFRKPFVNKEDEGEGMASILARSIIHVQTSLACIAETQDSEASPSSTIHRTSESEPNVNMSDEDKANNVTSLKNTSTEEIPIPPRERRISESCPATPMPDRSDNLLALPGEIGSYGSISSALSADSSDLETSSEEDDDESSDLKTDNERSVETTSSVVQSVMSHDLDPQFRDSMDKKLNVLESGSPDLKEVKSIDIKKEIDKKAVVEQEVFDTKILIDKCKSLESVPREVESKPGVKMAVRSNAASTSSVKDDTCVTKPSNHHIKLNNPFSHKKPAKSISEPSSPIDKSSFFNRSSRRIRRQLSKLSKSNMIKSISHYSLHLPKKKEITTALSQPGSSSDVRLKAPSSTVLGSPFLSYTDLMSLDKGSIDTNKFLHKSDDFDQVKVSMYIGSEPVSRSSLSGTSSLFHHREEPHHHHEKKHSLKSTGLVHTAMETILLDKVQFLLLPASPDPDSVKNKQFFDDVNEKLGLVDEYRNNKSNNVSVGSNINPMHSYRPNSPPPPVSNKPVIVSGIRKEKIHQHKMKPPSLMQTAMETMLMDQVQSVLMSTTPEPSQPELKFEGHELPESHEPHKNVAKKSISYIQSLLGPKSPDHTSPTERFFDSKKNKMSTGLVHTAMETMLMEKVQSVLGPETPEPVSSVFDDYDRPEEYNDHHHKKDDNSHSLFQTAVETMLLEKVQASALGGSVPDPVIFTDEERSQEFHKTDISTGMTHSAMETMLMDRFTSIVGQSDVPHVNPRHSDEDESEKHDRKPIKDDLKPTGLIHTAFETMLLEKVQASALGGSVPNPVISTEEEKYHELHKNKSSTGMTHTAMETMLMDKITSLVGQPETELEKHDQKSFKEDLKPGHTAETILPDKVQASPLETPVSVVGTEEDHYQQSQEKDDLTLASLIHTAASLGSSVPDPVVLTEDRHNINSHEKEEIGSHTHIATEPILMGKVQSLVDQQEITFVEPKTFSENEHPNDDLKSPGLVKNVVQNILLDKVNTLADEKEIAVEKLKESFEKSHSTENQNSSRLVDPSFETVPLDKVQTLISKEAQTVEEKTKEDEPAGTISTVFDKTQSLLPTMEVEASEDTKSIEKSEAKHKHKKLTRQDSVDSITENETPKMSKKSNKSSSDDTKPVLVIHGALETIPSLPETQDDVDETNNSVCDNSHAVCGVNRNERERDRREDKSDKDRGSPRHARHESYGGRDPVQTAHAQNSSLNSTSAPLGIHRRSSDSDLSVTPKGECSSI